MKNAEIRAIAYELQELLNIPTRGVFKFKLAKLSKQFLDKARIIEGSLEVDEKGVILNTQGNKEILELEDNFEFTKLTYRELEPLEISTRTVLNLEKIIEEEL